MLHPLSSASPALRLFLLTPSHIEGALELVALAFITVASIAVASTVVQPYAVEWRSASELLQSVLVPPELIAADTIPTDRASRALVAVISEKRNEFVASQLVFICLLDTGRSVGWRASAGANEFALR